MSGYTFAEQVRGKTNKYICVLTEPWEYGEGREKEAQRAFELERIPASALPYILEQLETIREAGAFHDFYADRYPGAQQRSKDLANLYYQDFIKAAVL